MTLLVGVLCYYVWIPCYAMSVGGFGVGRGTRYLPDVTFLTLGL